MQGLVQAPAPGVRGLGICAVIFLSYQQTAPSNQRQSQVVGLESVRRSSLSINQLPLATNARAQVVGLEPVRCLLTICSRIFSVEEMRVR
jgi:hypothetical protein